MFALPRKRTAARACTGSYTELYVVAVLGIGFYWLCCAIAGGLFGIDLLAAFNTEGYVGNERIIVTGTILFIALVIWVIGRVCRFLLSGY
jgi:hypothetical protein